MISHFCRNQTLALARRGLYLHQYQAHDLCKKYGVPLVQAYRASSSQQAFNIARRLKAKVTKGKNFTDVVVKAQVHAGGRGKGTFKESGLKGGVQITSKPEEVRQYAQQMIGKTLVTPQTGSLGKRCNQVFIMERIFLRSQFYFSLTLDRAGGCVTAICSEKGGVNIEDVDPKKIHKVQIPPGQQLSDVELNMMVKSYGLDQQSNRQLYDIISSCYRCFVESDATLLEINPLGLTLEGNVIACDLKINVDDNAGFRQAQIFKSEDLSQKNWKEVEAAKHDLNYIALDGNIGCMVNGAGLAMATMDLIQMKKGKPANFLDVGGRATDQQVIAALKIMDSDPNVQAILVNIFAGIARCDIIALGLIKGLSTLGMKKPIVLRMKGTNIEEAKKLIQDSGFNMIFTEDLEEAAEKAVKMAEILKMAREARLNINIM